MIRKQLIPKQKSAEVDALARANEDVRRQLTGLPFAPGELKLGVSVVNGQITRVYHGQNRKVRAISLGATPVSAGVPAFAIVAGQTFIDVHGYGTFTVDLWLC